MIDDGTTLLSVRREEMKPSGMPSITHNITIYEDRHFKMHCDGVEIPVKQVADICSVTGRISSVSEVLNVLARLKSISVDTASRLQSIAALLDSVAETNDNDGICAVVTFCAKQLRLITKPVTHRRYSQTLLGSAVIWDRISPKLYSVLQQSTMLCLPHSKTLRRLTSALQVSAGLDSATMTYLGMRLEKLQPRERLVNLAIDEVYCAQMVELAGGRLFGETSGAVAKTLFCVHINAVAGSYKDMVCMQPVPHVKASDISEIFHKVLKGLTGLGFQVVSVTTDNHRTNRAWHKSLGTDGAHPEYILNPYSEQEQKIFTMYDTVHVFKNTYYSLMRHKSLSLPPFPDSEDQQRMLEVRFEHLKMIHDSELGQPAKLAFKLTDKVLNPSVLERVNVQLAAAATDESTCAALRFHAEHRPGCEGFSDTATFLELIRRWFNICNVKSPYASHRLNDKNRVALRTGCEDSERSLQFITRFGEYMRHLLEIGSPLTKDTCLAVYHTSKGLVALAQYLLSTCPEKLDYVLLGKIQSDSIEAHFGHLRQLSGGNYWASVRQFLENEAVIRIKGLIWWSGFTVAEITARMDPSKRERQQEDAVAVQQLSTMVTTSDIEDISDTAKTALGHIAGYLARSVTKGGECSSCAELLIDRSSPPLEVQLEDLQQVPEIYTRFTELLDRGKLLRPSLTAIDLTSQICWIWRCLVHDETSRQRLFGCNLPRGVFAEVVAEASDSVAASTRSSNASDVRCCMGHTLKSVMNRMAGALFNLFAGNFVRETNSGLHNKRKNKAPISTGSDGRRSQTDDKRRKLCGVKKA